MESTATQTEGVDPKYSRFLVLEIRRS